MESLPENEVMTEELSVQLLTDDEQEQRMEMGVSDQGEGEGEGEGSERISLFDRSQNEIMKLIFAVNYRVPDEGHASFDVHAIFSTSQKIIKDSTKIIHNIIEQVFILLLLKNFKQ
ncbi:hypothetical protein D8674_033252 [Pyrus ussuriensis x Pyrus communis]|uniref:Uncharacterized protein n=1 Tax=Pyrus ussuriensis x Pyrus communis TaxID=2448454 RepID=A0A5N5HNS6_9ROSA|nr:hypothetical protein D8674_033252 [Pyrus ussuriensis x Pyrus communis]